MVCLSLSQKIFYLKGVTIVYMEENIKNNVIILWIVQLIMKCIFKKYVNLHYLHLMKNDIS